MSPQGSGESPIAETQMLFRNQSVSPLGGIVDCGFIKNGVGIPGESRRLGAYALVYVAYGSGSYRDESHEADVGAGDMIVVLPSTRHWYGPKPGAAFDTLHVIFEGPLFDAWLAAGVLSPSRPVIRLDPVEYWLGAMEASLGKGNQTSPRRSMDEALSLQTFLAEIALAGSVDESRGLWSEKAKSLVASSTNDRRVAAILGLSHETFRKKFARTVGISPTRYRTGLVMDEACRILATEDVTHRQIAQQLGFSDEFHFSRRFKDVVGVPPSTFRSRYR